MKTESYSRNKRLLYWTYYSLGGIYTSSNFTRFKKCAYFFFNMGTVFLVNVVGGLGYLLTVNVITILDIISATFMPSVVIYVLGIIPLITHYFHREFKTLFDYLENCAIVRSKGSYVTSEFIVIKKVNSISASLKWLIVGSVICTIYVLIGAVDIAIFCNQINSFRNLQHHMFPMPYLDRIPSIGVFWALYAVESIIFISLCVAGLPEVTFVSMITCEFNNIVTEYCTQMQIAGDHVNDTMDRWKTSNDELVFRRMEKNLKFFTFEHRRLIDMIDLIRPYIEIFDTMLLVAIFHALLICIYLLLLTDLDYCLKFKQVVAVWCACMYLYPHCELGTKFNNMNEAIILQVYGLPWYHLPPKQRQLVHLLLCQVQKPIKFRAFKMYVVDLAIVPQILSKAYSSINLLHRSIDTGHNTFRERV